MKLRLLSTVGLALATFACRDVTTANGTALFVTETHGGSFQIDQLSFSVLVPDGGAPLGPVMRPDTPASALTSGQSLRLLLPDTLGGQTVSVVVLGLWQGQTVARGEAPASIQRGSETAVTLSLAPWSVSGDGGLDGGGADAGPGGDGGLDAGGGRDAGSCGPCDPIRADGCSGSCTCGGGAECAVGQHCSNGHCGCDSQSCAGCCAGTNCVSNPTSSQCGSAGGACQACPDGGACNGGVCAGCDSTTCAQGCCSGPSCNSASLSTCGTAGGACVACDAVRANTCGSSGACQCGGGAICDAGQACSGSNCVCNAQSCTGCCVGNTCVTSESAGQCGGAGTTCQPCDSNTADRCQGGSCSCGGGAACGLGQRCSGGACVCNAQSCPNSCCNGNACATPSLSECGTGGNACKGCDGQKADHCASGTCLCGSNPACGSGLGCVSGQCMCTVDSCAGCCASNACKAGNTVGACGSGGNACTACDARSNNCSGGQCTCGTNPPCPSGQTCVIGLGGVAICV